jgi:general L-amino acid transport system permease protein
MALSEFPKGRMGGVLTLWRDIRVQRFVFQAVFVVVVLTAGYLILTNIDDELSGRNLELFPFVQTTGSFPFIDVTLDFLDARAGFSIDDRAFGFDYTANDSYFRALLTGLVNTIQVSIIGIVLATILGIVVGVGRLSTNWLVSRVATMYVETFRNIPLLVQLIFWYLAVYLKAPRIAESLDFFGIAYLSNRAVALPKVSWDDGAAVWLVFLLIGGVAAGAVKVWRTRREENTGEPSYPWWFASGVFVLIAGIGFVLSGTPLTVDTPEVRPSAYQGGITLRPEYAALLTGLVIYTAAFIAEIVRGSILAIPKGQTEASAAVGLNPLEALRFVIFPQALLIIIPPLTNQYLNLMKNSSLAVAVGFKDLFDVGRISINQTGQALPVITLIMLTYLMLSLSISAVMNFIYSRLRWGVR